MTESDNQQQEKAPTQAEIARLRNRFNNAEAKLVKLEALIENFEKEHGPIDQVNEWVGNIEQLRKNIETKHQECVNAVDKVKTDFDTLIAQKTQEITLIVEEESNKLTTHVHQKTGKTSDLIQKALIEFEGNLANQQSDLDQLLTQTDEDAKKIQSARNISEDDRVAISTIKAECQKQKEIVDQHLVTITKILDDAQKALTSATSAGLAKDFEAQKKALKDSQANWVIVLIISLMIAAGIAYFRFDSILALLSSKEPVSNSHIFINCLLSVTAIAAPVWIAWLATKQVGYNFRLSEDYAFKAATAASFEGFRKEIEAFAQEDEINDELRVRLLTTILDRLDEQPLRYVDKQMAGSPIHELLQKFPWIARKGNSAEEQKE